MKQYILMIKKHSAPAKKKITKIKMVRLNILILFLLIAVCPVAAQDKYEREYRIRKSQFPEKALAYIEDRLKDARRIRFYKETDSTKTSYGAKFKKDRLKYSIEFSEDGVLKDIELLIKPVDIPDEYFSKINEYFKMNFVKYRIQKIQQQYPVDGKDVETIVKNAFQNLMLPYIKYEIIVSGKKDKDFAQFEVLFDAEGRFEKLRKSLPPNYDHILY